MSLSQGMRLGPYEISAPLGSGGMGDVWSPAGKLVYCSVSRKSGDIYLLEGF